MTPFTETHFQTLFAYHWHVTQRLLEAAAQLAPEVYAQAQIEGDRTLHDVLLHLRNASRNYRLVLETGQRPPRPDSATVPDLPAVRAAFAEEQTRWEALLARLTADEIESRMDVVLRDGPTRFPRWHFLQQVVLHGMQHHAEIADFLTRHGQSPGDIDFIMFVRD